MWLHGLKVYILSCSVFGICGIAPVTTYVQILVVENGSCTAISVWYF